MTTNNKRFGRAYITFGLSFAMLFSGSLALGTPSAHAETASRYDTAANWTDLNNLLNQDWNQNWNPGWNQDWNQGGNDNSGNHGGNNGSGNAGGSNSGSDSDTGSGSNTGGDSKPSAGSSTASDIIAKGKTFMGTPYKFGSKSGNTKSFDCSSFTQYLFEQAGISIPRSSKEQSTFGTYVPRSELKPGDLVFFYSPVHHVALYIGNGKILHTYGKPGVTINDLNSGWWDEHYTTARRVIKQ